MTTPRDVRISCPTCDESLAVVTRTQFGDFEETHVQTCHASWVSVTDGTLDDVFDLPPY